MTAYEIIQKKRDGGTLSGEELRFFLTGCLSGDIPDYQAAAFLMAAYLRGMTDEETYLLTKEMIATGDTVDLSRFGELSADKHSTGGVGDKTTLIVAPIAASEGLKIAKMSGRGLGHTGGTVDKLESIPGYRTDLTVPEFLAQAEKAGIAVVGANKALVPADKYLYSLRDVTATVSSIPLIASSIMSKKLAAGAKNIVLDVKYGSGAFMKTAPEAEALARKMIDIGKRFGRNMAAVISNMDRPLGEAVGNALELSEAVDVLRGYKGGDIREISLALASELIALAKGLTPEEGYARAVDALDSGRAYKQMQTWIASQGGDVSVLEKNTSTVSREEPQQLFTSPRTGYISHMDTEKIGLVSTMLGAGRRKKEDVLDMDAGLMIMKKTGDHVKVGEPMFALFSKTADLHEAAQAYLDALTFSDEAPANEPLIYKVIR